MMVVPASSPHQENGQPAAQWGVWSLMSTTLLANVGPQACFAAVPPRTSVMLLLLLLLLHAAAAMTLLTAAFSLARAVCRPLRVAAAAAVHCSGAHAWRGSAGGIVGGVFFWIHRHAVPRRPSGTAARTETNSNVKSHRPRRVPGAASGRGTIWLQRRLRVPCGCRAVARATWPVPCREQGRIRSSNWAAPGLVTNVDQHRQQACWATERHGCATLRCSVWLASRVFGSSNCAGCDCRYLARIWSCSAAFSQPFKPGRWATRRQDRVACVPYQRCAGDGDGSSNRQFLNM